jgi:hypothetical protein
MEWWLVEEGRAECPKSLSKGQEYVRGFLTHCAFMYCCFPIFKVNLMTLPIVGNCLRKCQTGLALALQYKLDTFWLNPYSQCFRFHVMHCHFIGAGACSVGSWAPVSLGMS